MSKKSDGSYHHGNLREALVTTALDLLQREGTHALTLRAVGTALGVSHAAPVYWFPTKGDLLAAVAEEGFQRLARAMRAAEDGRERADRLAQVGLAYVTFGVRHPALFETMFSADLVAQTRRTPEFLAASAAAFGVFAEAVGDTDPLGELALSAWSTAHGLVALFRGGPLPCHAPELDADGFLARATPVLVAAANHLSNRCCAAS